MVLFRTPIFLRVLYPGLIWRVPTNDKKIYLTFDDGPVPGPTEFALSTLNKFQAKATFFCIGNNVKKHPETFRKIMIEGHKIGNHTYNHLNGWSTSKKYYSEDVEKCQKTIGDSKLFRPPFGRISRNQIRALKDYQIVMWDVLTYDYAKSKKPERLLKGAKNATRSGSIVVFHDSYKAEKNMSYVLPRFLEHFRSLGYTFDMLPDEFK